MEKLQDLSASNQIDKLQGQIIKNVVFQGWSSYLIQWLNCNQTILKHSCLRLGSFIENEFCSDIVSFYYGQNTLLAEERNV